MVKNKAAKVKVEIITEDIELTSHNVVVTLEGSKYPDEIISFGAHYDSVPFSTGVYDNGAGSVILMEMLRHFKKIHTVITKDFSEFIVNSVVFPIERKISDNMRKDLDKYFNKESKKEN